jgi:hypothetical protein
MTSKNFTTRARPHLALVSQTVALLAVLCTVVPAAQPDAIERHTDQIGIVFPAFDGSELFGSQVAYLLKLAVQSKLRSEDRQRPNARFGYGIAYWTPKPLRDPTPTGAVALAQLNGLHGTIWGTVYPLEDGVAVQGFLSLAPAYRDFREHRLEQWTVQVGSAALSVEPPRTAVTFAPALFEREVLKSFGDPRGIKHCPVKGGECRYFDTYQIDRAYEFTGSSATVRRGGIDYRVSFPNTALLNTDIIDYTSLVIAYYRGDWNLVRDLAGQLLRNKETSTSVAIDTYLYRGAAAYRLGESGSADFKRAAELNPDARRVVTYTMMGMVGDVVRRRMSSTELRAEWQRLSPRLDAKDPFVTAAQGVLEQLR